MSFFGKKLTFKYKKEFDSKLSREIYYPAIDIILKWEDNQFETTAIIDSGSDMLFISEEVADTLNLKLGKEETADVLGGGNINVRTSNLNLILVRGKNRIDLGIIPVSVGMGIKGKESSMDIVIGRNPVFDKLKIIFEQYKKIITIEKFDLKWRKY